MGVRGPPGGHPEGHLERPSRDGFGRQVFREHVATGFSGLLVDDENLNAPGCGPSGHPWDGRFCLGLCRGSDS